MWWGCVCTQSQTRRSPGCTSYTMELRVGAAQDGRNSSEEHKRHLLYLEAGNNTPTWNSAPRFPSAIVSPPVRRATEERGKGGRGGGGGTETDFFFFPSPRPDLGLHQKTRLLFSFRGSGGSPGRGLTDSSLYAALLCDSYHTGPESSARRLLISLLFRGMKIHTRPPPPAASDAYRHEFVTPRTSGGEMNIIKNGMRKKWGETIRANKRKGQLEKFTVAENGPRAAFLRRIKGKDS